MSKRNIETTVERETTIGKVSPLSHIGMYHSNWSTEHVDIHAKVETGKTTSKLSIHCTVDAAMDLAKRIAKEFDMTATDFGFAVETAEIEDIHSL